MRKILALILILCFFGITGFFGSTPKAPKVKTDVTNFDGNLNSNDVNVQLALDKIDDIILGGDSQEVHQDHAWMILVDAESDFTLIALTYEDATDSISITVENDLNLYSWTNVDGTDLKTGSITQAYDVFLQDIADLTDPAADRLLGWDDTDNDIRWVVIGSGLSYDQGTDTLSSTGSQLTEEQVEDYVGTMLTGTETLITVDYVDGGVGLGTIDFVVESDLNLYSWTNVDSTDLKVGSVTQAFDTDLDALSTPTTWRMFYSDGADPFIQQISLGADGTFLESNGVATAPAFRALVAGDIPDISATYQPLDAELTALAGLTSAANKLPYFTGSGTADVTDISAYIRGLLDDADEATLHTSLNLDPGTDIQVYDATLLSIAALGTVADRILYTTATDVWAEQILSTYVRGLLDDADEAALHTSLNLDPGTDIQVQDAFLQDIADLTDPAADRLLGWDDTDNDIRWFIIGSGLSYDAGTDTLTGTGSQLTEEEVEDYVGTMLTGTETLITVDYVDGGVGLGTIDFVVESDLNLYSWTNVDGTDLKVGVITQDYDVDLDALATPTAWRMFYSDAADGPFIQEIVLGADGTFLESNGAAAAPAFRALVAGDIPDISATYQPLDTFLSDIAALTDPAADRILGWDDTDNDIRWMIIGTGLTYTPGTDTLTASAGSPGFDDINTGSNNSATMTVASGASIVYTAGGIIDATRFLGITTIDATEFGYINNLSENVEQRFDNILDGTEAFTGFNMASTTDPAWEFDVTDVDDTDWTIGTNADAGATSDDFFEFRQHVTEGNLLSITIDPATGDVKYYGAAGGVGGDNAFSILWDVTNPTADRTITVPNEDVLLANIAVNTTHKGSTGADHTYIDQDVTSGSGPAFTSIQLTTPVLGTITSGVGTALTALNGENIQDNTIDEDSIDWGSGAGQIDLVSLGVSATTTELDLLSGETDIANQAELDAVAALVDTDDEIIAIINNSPSTAIGAAAGGTGIQNNAASTITISGNYATTFTVSAATGVTLPTAGTLLANLSEDASPSLGGALAGAAYGMATTGIVTGGAATPVDDTAANFAANFTGANLYGGTFVANTAGTAQLPAVGVGMNFCVTTKGAIAISMDTNINDLMILDGVPLNDGDKATNLSAAGDIICFQYYDATGWLATSNGWTDGGA